MTGAFWPVLAALCCSAAHADAGNSTEDSDEAIPEIIVTGSHIRRAADDGPAPVVVFDAAMLSTAGVNTLQDFARYLPINAGVPNDEQTSSSAAPGTSHINLRGIGEQATLVLVNGRRIAPYGSPQSSGRTFVDINSIPFAAIERIEVLKDGASAIYGSDAIAGVVNIVLKQRYEGVSASAAYLSTTRDDATETTLDVLWGNASARTSFMAGASYLQREPMVSTDRHFLADMNLRPAGGFNNRNGFSSPMTAFRPDIGRAEAEPACPADTGHPLAFVTPIRQPNVRLDSLCTMNQKLFTHSIPASERLGVTSFVNHELGEATALFADLLLTAVRTDSQLPPPMTNKPTVPWAPFPVAPADHPGNPYDTPVAMSYSIIDAGPRLVDTESLSSRLAAGIKADRGGWSWDLSFAWSESEVDTTHIRPVDSQLFQEALFGAGGPGRDQFYNPFGLYPSNPSEVIAAFQVPTSRRRDRMRELVLDAQVQGLWMELPGGTVGWAAGAQYREQHGMTSGDEFQASGRALGIDLLRPMRARREIESVYAEAAIPVTETLDLQLALRHERYDDFGNATHPKLGLRWAPSDSIAFRASHGTSFRAPTFAELYRPEVEGQAIVSDTTRCDVTNAPADCVRFPYTTFSSGNEGLQPEEGRSWYMDVSLTPTPELSLSIGAWRFEHADRIFDLGPQFIIDKFGSDPAIVVRRPPAPTDPAGIPGPIDHINTKPLNVEKLRIQGVDATLEHRADSTFWDEFSFLATMTYLDEYILTESADERLLALNLAGGADLFPLPRVRGNMRLQLARGATRVTAAMHYVGRYQSPINRVVDDLQTVLPFRVGDHVTLDLQFAYTVNFETGTTVRLGCQNCADTKPPVYNYTWTGESLHDPRGAIVYARWVQGF